ncbi:hypothetical protein JOY44_02840 [Phormidium sp. CLA17]|nr:hypothetical protein [Leptolyngbya sp. Cla-17]
MMMTDKSVNKSNSALAVLDRPVSDELASVEHQVRLLKVMKNLYQVDQQAKFLHLQAETNSLLEQLQALKGQRDSSI